MCSILGIIDVQEQEPRTKILEMARRVRHRGPDSSGLFEDEYCVLAHERLAIVDPQSGMQPLYDKEKKHVLIANGEIYNHLALRKQTTYAFQTQSDSEILLALYKEKGISFLDYLDGMFAFALYDVSRKEVFVARDPVGIIPLYYGKDDRGQVYIASEAKALVGYCERVEEFPAGHYYSSQQKEFVRWHKRKWMKTVPTKEVDLDTLKKTLEESVKKHLMSDVPYGVLISGGLDSSLIAAMAKKYSKDELHSFAIGLVGSPDLLHAKKVAKYLGTIHHEITYTVQEGIDALPDVIKHIETFDVTTIRASTPMYLLARKIKSLGIKMVLSGEGADELFGGYLYFHMAPSKEEFHEETVRKLSFLSKYDCLRANKTMAAWGVETRVPFLDTKVVDYVMSFDPEDKLCSSERMEKWVLREACKEYLPKEVLWRQKEQFSDGVGYRWIDSLKEKAEEEVSEEVFLKAKSYFPEKTPSSKEEFYYRTIFETFFPGKILLSAIPTGPTIACSTPTAVKWSKQFSLQDPSGRAVASIHKKAYGEN